MIALRRRRSIVLVLWRHPTSAAFVHDARKEPRHCRCLVPFELQWLPHVVALASELARAVLGVVVRDGFVDVALEPATRPIELRDAIGVKFAPGGVDGRTARSWCHDAAIERQRM